MGEREIKNNNADQIRLVVSDMDGTLLRSDKTVSDFTMETLGKLREKGIDFTICTGRIATMIEYYARTFEIETPIITSNGAALWDAKKRQILFERPVQTDVALEVIDFCKKYQLDCSALTIDACYFTGNSRRKQKFVDYNKIAQEFGYEQIHLEYFDENNICIRDKSIHKILVYAFDDKQFTKAKEFLDTIKDLTYTSSDKNLLDISAKGISKGSGLLELMKVGDYKKEQTCAFGDYYNDISMLNAAGYSFAMGNGCDEIKKIATKIVGSNDNDGVANAIQEYILSGKL